MEEIKKLLRWNSERMQQGEVVLVPTFYGKSGVGKTWRAKALYRELRAEQPDLLWARLLPGTMLPEEALGLPKVTEKETIWTAPSWAVKGQPVFLFVDELEKMKSDVGASDALKGNDNGSKPKNGVSKEPPRLERAPF